MCHLWVCLQKHPSKIIPVILWNLEEKRNQPAVECLLFAMHQMHVPVPQKNPAMDLLLCPLCRSETGLKHLITRSKPGLYFISPPYHVVPVLRHALKGLETKKDRGKNHIFVKFLRFSAWSMRTYLCKHIWTHACYQRFQIWRLEILKEKNLET